MYIFEGRKHGDIDLSKPSRFGVYPPDINERALKEMKKRSSSKYSISNVKTQHQILFPPMLRRKLYLKRGDHIMSLVE